MDQEKEQENEQKKQDSFIAVGKEEHTGRYLFTIKDPSVVSGQDGQAGVYLDTCVSILTINWPDRFWIFWLAPDATGKVKGHTTSGRKSVDEGDVLEDFRRDLLAAGFPHRNLHACHSLEDAHTALVNKVKVTPDAADNIITYLKKNAAQ